MTPEEWPIWTPADREGHSPALAAGGDRLSTVRQDFFLSPTHRLTEQERALMTSMLQRLVEDIAAELQAHLPQEWLPANEDPDEMMRRLWQARSLDEPGLLALLLRRADEERISTAFQARQGQRAGQLIQPIVSSGDSQAAAAAMSVLVARGRRRDRFGQPLIEIDDLPAPAASRLIHSVAAALCDRLPVNVSVTDAERRLCDSALALIARVDSERSLDWLSSRLVTLLHQAGHLDDNWIRSAIDAAEISMIGHALAARSSLSLNVVLAELLSGDCRRIMMLVRLSSVPRELAAYLVGVLGDYLGIRADSQAMTEFDGIGPDRIAAARGWLGLNPEFQNALKAMSHGHGRGNL